MGQWGMGFWAYCKAVQKCFWKDLVPRVEWVVVALIVGAITAVLLDKFALVGNGQVWLRILVAAIPAAVILLAYAAVHALRAPWKLHRAEAYAHNDTREQLEGEITDLKRLNCVA
jgi:hypothetical protein